MIIYIPPEKNVGESVHDINANFDYLDRKNTDKSYEHIQGTFEKAWVITHNLNKKPSVTVVDAEGNNVICDIDYTSNNVVTLYFSEPAAGTAYLN